MKTLVRPNGLAGEALVRPHEGRLRIAFLAARDPNDRRSWSGAHYFMAQALAKHCGELTHIVPLRPISAMFGKIAQKAVRRLTGKSYLYTHTDSISRKLGRMAEQKLARVECDVIFAPTASVVLAHLNTQVPIVYTSDATSHLLFDYYPEFTNVLESHVRLAESMEQAAIAKASQLVYPSSWAAESAVRDYHADPSRISIVPLGANFENPPSRDEVVPAAKHDRCRLLFVGVEWERKGGDIAIETMVELERLGVKAALTVVGCASPDRVTHPHVTFIPFISKNDVEGCARLDRLYRESDFLLLPTRAECYGIVFCEANAFGMPVLSTRTGGVPDLVRDGVNGFLLPLEARGDQYAARIRDTYSNATNYQNLRESSRKEFETRLNWDAWGKQMNIILRNAVASSRARQALQ